MPGDVETARLRIGSRAIVLGVYGIAILLILLGLGKAARHFHVGPEWLKQVTIGRCIHY
jgi:hypothetical protein